MARRTPVNAAALKDLAQTAFDAVGYSAGEMAETALAVGWDDDVDAATQAECLRKIALAQRGLSEMAVAISTRMSLTARLPQEA